MNAVVPAVTGVAMLDPAASLAAMAAPQVGEPVRVAVDSCGCPRFLTREILEFSFSPFFTFMRTKKSKSNKNKYPFVKVVWRDSNIYRFQDSIEYAVGNYAIEVITTVGFLIGYQVSNPIIARDLMNKGIDQRCSIVIPKENIVSLTKIKGDSSMSEHDKMTWLPKLETKQAIKNN